jgi:hypothetical protein
LIKPVFNPFTKYSLVVWFIHQPQLPPVPEAPLQLGVIGVDGVSLFSRDEVSFFNIFDMATKTTKESADPMMQTIGFLSQ